MVTVASERLIRWWPLPLFFANVAQSPARRIVSPPSSTSTTSPEITHTNSSWSECQCLWLDHAPGASSSRFTPKWSRPPASPSARRERARQGWSNGGGYEVPERRRMDSRSSLGTLLLLVAQLAPQDLADVALGQRIAELDVLRALVAGQLV